MKSGNKTRILFLIVTMAAMAFGAPTAAAQDWFTSPSEPSGHVTGAVDQPARGLYRVEISEIMTVQRHDCYIWKCHAARQLGFNL